MVLGIIFENRNHVKHLNPKISVLGSLEQCPTLRCYKVGRCCVYLEGSDL